MRGVEMSNFVGDNPVLLSGSVISAGDERIVIGDDRGHSLTFSWSGIDRVREHGSPAAIVIDLPSADREPRCSVFRIHAEGRHAQLRYAVEPIGDRLRRVSYTLIEDIGALLVEAETPGLSAHDPAEGSRIGLGPG
jgi:hypothetical protein